MPIRRLSPARVDPRRRAVAAHECGHLLVWRAVGILIRDVRVTGTGRHRLRNPAQAHGYVIGILGGTGSTSGCATSHTHPEREGHDHA